VCFRATGDEPYKGRGRIREAEIRDKVEELNLGAVIVAFIETINDDQHTTSRA
jgi:hypothetical protein